MTTLQHAAMSGVQPFHYPVLQGGLSLIRFTAVPSRDNVNEHTSEVINHPNTLITEAFGLVMTFKIYMIRRHWRYQYR